MNNMNKIISFMFISQMVSNVVGSYERCNDKSIDNVWKRLCNMQMTKDYILKGIENEPGYRSDYESYFFMCNSVSSNFFYMDLFNKTTQIKDLQVELNPNALEKCTIKYENRMVNVSEVTEGNMKDSQTFLTYVVESLAKFDLYYNPQNSHEACILCSRWDNCFLNQLRQFDYQHKKNARFGIIDNKYREKFRGFTQTGRSASSESFNKLNLDKLYTYYEVDMDLKSTEFLDYENIRKGTIWKKFKLDIANARNLDCEPYTNVSTVNCNNPFYEFPEFFKNTWLSVNVKSFSVAEPSSPIFSFDENVIQNLSRSKKFRWAQSKSSLEYGIQTTGCNGFKLIIKMEWTKNTETHNNDGLYIYNNFKHWKPGYKNTYNSPVINPTKWTEQTYDCYERKIYIEDIADSDVKMSCFNSINLNNLKTISAKYMNATSKNLDFEKFAPHFKDITKYMYAKDDELKYRIPYSNSFLRIIKECVESEEGKRWVGYSPVDPGYCTGCMLSKSKFKYQSIFCDANNVGHRNKECCFQCKEPYLELPGSTQNMASDPTIFLPNCFKGCRRNFKRTSSGCVACEKGKTSMGGIETTCQTCAEQKLYNHIVTLNGCEPCGSYKRSVDERTCADCQEKEIVIGATDNFCKKCGTGEYPKSNGENSASCTPCESGKYWSNYECIECDEHEYQNNSGALNCEKCPVGTYPNQLKQSCVRCAELENMNAEYYQQDSCGRIRCKHGFFLKAGSDIYQNNTCLSCQNETGNIGFYWDLSDCSQKTCTNILPSNAFFYSGASPGMTTCEWDCNIGYQRSGAQCVPCTALNYDPKKHEFTDNSCNFNCKKYIYKDDRKICNQSCINLLNEFRERRIFSRVSQYNGIQRRNYVLGRCGDVENYPLHEIRIIRKGLWAYVSEMGTGECGNSVLNEGEECDDGNKISNDGCSATCKIETSKYWDCDIIGELCLANCGWKETNENTWGLSLYGYRLPPCIGGVCNCENLRYNDIRMMKSGERAIWMKQHFISCDCYGNIHRMFEDYGQCTSENHGCVPCLQNEYYHDLRKECVPCGTNCMEGYRPYSNMLASGCSNSTDFTFKQVYELQLNESLSKENFQALLGCTPCTTSLNTELIRYIRSSPIGPWCEYMCYRDSTGTDRSEDAYCSSEVNNVTGACSGICSKCSLQFATKKNNWDTLPQTKKGKYLKGCVDKYGYVEDDCNPDSKPLNSEWSQWSEKDLLYLENKDKCPWTCSTGYYKYDDSTCLQLFRKSSTYTSSPCPKKSDVIQSFTTHDAYCLSCDKYSPDVLGLYKVWETMPPYYSSCIQVCEEGVSWKYPYLNETDECTLCKALECDIGEFYQECTLTSDAQCLPCTLISRNHEFYKKSSCDQRCKAGYYNNGFTCVVCDLITCRDGQYLSTSCEREDERNANPVCLECPNLRDNEEWIIGHPKCGTICAYLFIRSDNGSCVQCTPSLCGNGMQGNCEIAVVPGSVTILETYLKCVQCGTALTEHMFFERNGTCTTTCIHGYMMNDEQFCVEIPKTVIEEEDAIDPIIQSMFENQYPERENQVF